MFYNWTICCTSWSIRLPINLAVLFDLQIMKVYSSTGNHHCRQISGEKYCLKFQWTDSKWHYSITTNTKYNKFYENILHFQEQNKIPYEWYWECFFLTEADLIFPRGIANRLFGHISPTSSWKSRKLDRKFSMQIHHCLNSLIFFIS